MMPTVDQVNAAALKVLNIAREALSDLSHEVSAPGESSAGEFYVTLDGIELAIRVEPI